MTLWQLVALGFLVLLPFALLADFHPRRERLDAAGHPLARRSPGDGPGDRSDRGQSPVG